MSDQSETEGAGTTPLAIIESMAPEGWKQKIGRVVAQLGIGTRKGAALYAAGRDQIDLAEGKSLVNKAMAEAVAREAVENPQMMERARARFLGEFGAKQENLEAVMIAAVGHLNDGPVSPMLLEHNSTAETSSPKPEESPSTQPISDNEAAPLDSDWAAAFTREAENATSDELRDRLAQVLAGEIRAPGTYSRGVLRSIAELDREDLEAVRECLPFRVRDAIYNDAGGETKRINRLLKLADAGLAVDTTSGLSRVFNFTPERDLFVSATFGSFYGIIIRKADANVMHKPFAPLNRAGQSVADLLDSDWQFERQAVKNLGLTFLDVATEIILAKVTGRSGDEVSWSIEEYIKARSFPNVVSVKVPPPGLGTQGLPYGGPLTPK